MSQSKYVLCGALSVMPWVGHAQPSEMLGSNAVEKPTIQSTMNHSSCMEYSPSIVQSDDQIIPGKPGTFGFLCGFKPGKPPKPVFAWKGTFSYWEPSAVIEVSCRNGFSHLMPGMAGRGDKTPQSCSKVNGKWFFEARVWGVDGMKGSTRQQATGSDNINEQMRACGGGSSKKYDHGYGKKWDMFSHGGGGGPAGSWAAYISDQDENWAKSTVNTSLPPNTEKCTQGTPSVAECWGSMQNLTGWVDHPYQPVAAALAAWRAHEKARQANKVSPALSGGYKMEMDYPFIRTPSAHAQSMGLSGGGSGRIKGSDCFQPGDPGPWWYMPGDGKQKQISTEEIINKIQNLQKGDASKQGGLNTGVYIFTIWVKTACTVYSTQYMACKDQFDY